MDAYVNLRSVGNPKDELRTRTNGCERSNEPDYPIATLSWSLRPVVRPTLVDRNALCKARSSASTWNSSHLRTLAKRPYDKLTR